MRWFYSLLNKNLLKELHSLLFVLVCILGLTSFKLSKLRRNTDSFNFLKHISMANNTRLELVSCFKLVVNRSWQNKEIVIKYVWQFGYNLVLLVNWSLFFQNSNHTCNALMAGDWTIGYFNYPDTIWFGRSPFKFNVSIFVLVPVHIICKTIA